MQQAARVARSPWKLFDTPRRGVAAPLVCLCLPYAGGSASVFSEWEQTLGGSMDVIPAHLPGRGKRFCEAPYLDFEELLDDLEVAALPMVDRPFVLFGHSLGGLLAYELAVRLHARHMRNAVHVFISGTASPCTPPSSAATIQDDDYRLSDVEFSRKLATLGGLPPEVTTHPELMQLTLAAVRADFRVYESRKVPLQPRRIASPITAFGGLGDLNNVPEHGLRGWARYTQSRFALHLLPGDHFFLKSQRQPILDRMLREVHGDGRRHSWNREAIHHR